jgi:hypothetical protein
MSDSLATERFNALRRLGYTGDSNKMFFEFLGTKGGTGNTVNDRFVSWMAIVQPTKKQLTDAWYAFLGTSGYTGDMNTRETAYWLAQ